VSQAERQTGLWRVAHRSDPLAFTPHERCSWGHRFDDTTRRHRTLYCAEAPQTALREVLADLRPNATVIAEHLERYGTAAADSLPRTPITERWRQENVLVPCALAYEGRLLDLTDPDEQSASSRAATAKPASRYLRAARSSKRVAISLR
jgi:RES domain